MRKYSFWFLVAIIIAGMCLTGCGKKQALEVTLYLYNKYGGVQGPFEVRKVQDHGRVNGSLGIKTDLAPGSMYVESKPYIDYGSVIPMGVVRGNRCYIYSCGGFDGGTQGFILNNPIEIPRNKKDLREVFRAYGPHFTSWETQGIPCLREPLRSRTLEEASEELDRRNQWGLVLRPGINPEDVRVFVLGGFGNKDTLKDWPWKSTVGGQVVYYFESYPSDEEHDSTQFLCGKDEESLDVPYEKGRISKAFKYEYGYGSQVIARPRPR